MAAGDFGCGAYVGEYPADMVASDAVTGRRQVCSGDSATCTAVVSVSVDTGGSDDVCSEAFAQPFAETVAASLNINASRVRVDGLVGGVGCSEAQVWPFPTPLLRLQWAHLGTI